MTPLTAIPSNAHREQVVIMACPPLAPSRQQRRLSASAAALSLPPAALRAWHTATSYQSSLLEGSRIQGSIFEVTRQGDIGLSQPLAPKIRSVVLPMGSP